MTLFKFPDTDQRAENGPPTPPQPRRRTGGRSRENTFDLVGAAGAGLCVSILLFGQLATLSGPIGFVVVGYLVFLAVYGVLVALREDGPAVRDALMTVVLTTAMCIAFGALALVVGFTLWRGRTALVHLNFFTQDLSKAGPLAPLKVGGVAHALVGTMWMIGIALVLTVPLGLICAVYLDQTRSRPALFVRSVVQAMTALPTILAGLFIYAFLILILGFQQSGLAAALALSIMMLPYLIRTSDLVLRLVPNGLREASDALGAPRWRTVWHVVLPTARSGLGTGVILATARGIGEASPVLLTAGYTTYLNADPVHGPMVSLPLLALKLVASGVPTYIARGFACATFLLLVIVVLFIVARIVGGWGPGHLSPRQRRRVARASARDAARFSSPMWAAPDVGGTR
ncbi:MAG: phosphate ABC transporter permease PstA [Acidimicrobiales bacterium]|jgi:phosphate transport system permease protein